MRVRDFFCAVGLLAASSCSTAAVSQETSGVPRALGLLISEDDQAESGAVESIALGTHARVANTGVAYDPDARLRRLADPSSPVHAVRTFLLGARAGRIHELDDTGAIVRDFSSLDAPSDDAGSADPVDLALDARGRLWISRYLKDSVRVLNPDGSFALNVDLGDLADPFPAGALGTPRVGMSAIAIVKTPAGERAFVALRNLGPSSTVTRDAKLVTLDTTTLARTVTTLPSNARNPWERFRRRDDGPETELWLQTIGGPRDQPPHVEAALLAIDVAVSPPSVRIAWDTGKQGAFIAGFHVADAHTGYASLATIDDARENPTSIVVFDPSTGGVRATWASTDKYRLWDVTFDGASNLLFVIDRSDTAPGVRLLDATPTGVGAQVGFVTTRLLPLELAIVRGG